MNYPIFKEKVRKEFHAWLQEAEAARPRADVGARITSPDQLRVGDTFYKPGGIWRRGSGTYKVVATTPKTVIAVRINEVSGVPLSDKKFRFTAERFRRSRVSRAEDVKRLAVPDENVLRFVEKVGYPKREIADQAKYRAWLEEALLTNQSSPYYQLQDFEVEEKKKLQEQLDKILKDRGIGSDWKWEPPSRVEIGERVLHPLQVEPGDFFRNLAGTTYKVLEREGDDVLRVSKVNAQGVLEGIKYSWDEKYLRDWEVKRVEPVVRKKPTFEEIKKYADEEIGFPDRSVKTQGEYRDWLKERLTKTQNSPYYDLGEEEAEHKQLLNKQLDEILKDRGVHDDWEWQPPPHAEVGQRIRDPFQLHVGDCFQPSYGNQYRVLEISDSGKIRAARLDSEGRPRQINTYGPSDFRDRSITRVKTQDRPEVSFEDIKKYLEGVGSPGKAINTRKAYQEWLKLQLTKEVAAPFFLLGENETKAKGQLEKHIDKLLEERGVGEDWTWTPPPSYSIGDRVRDPYRLRVGDFIQREGRDSGFRVVDIADDGRVALAPFDKHGRPAGRMGPGNLVEFNQVSFKYDKYNLIEPLKRKIPSESEVLDFAEQAAPHPGREVADYDKYRDWLQNIFTTDPASPYVGLGDDEEEHKTQLDKYIDKILKKRNIGKDWKWTPPPPITFSQPPDWDVKQKQVLDMAAKGKPVGRDKRLNEEGVAGAKKRRMTYNGREGDFIFKAQHAEPGMPGARVEGGRRIGVLACKAGCPKGTLHQREQGAYEIDKLLGEGVIVPATISTGTGETGLGSYQDMIPGLKSFNRAGNDLKDISTDDLLRHQDVQRLLVLDAITGHQDRHRSNLTFSLVDPTKKATADNVRFHAIDNGYSLARTEAGQYPGSWDIRDSWSFSGPAPGRDELMAKIFEYLPDYIYDRVKKVDRKDLMKALARTGFKDASVLEAAAVRLAVLQNNREALGKLIKEAGGYSTDGQREFQYMSHHEPAKLFREYTDLPESTVEDIAKEAKAALREAQR